MFGKKEENGRFKEIYNQGGMLSSLGATVIQDTSTGVNYLLVKTGGAIGGITVLLDKDGNPVITPVEDIKP